MESMYNVCIWMTDDITGQRCIYQRGMFQTLPLAMEYVGKMIPALLKEDDPLLTRHITVYEENGKDRFVEVCTVNY